MVCIWNSIHGGLKEKVVKAVEEIVCRMYGMRHVYTVNNMVKCGLVSNFGKSSNWKEVKERFNLINENEEDEGGLGKGKEKDYSYIYILYASLM